MWRWARLGAGAAILGAVVWRLGTGPIVAGLHTIDAGALVAAAAITAVTTVCSACRWMLVARGVGVALPLRTAVGAYYRSQFLNVTLPGGVLGDVHRAVRHGRDAGDVARGVRGVVWERAAGQLVQVSVAVIVLLALASPVQPVMPLVLVLLLASVLAARRVLRLTGSGGSRWARTLRTARADVRNGLLAPAVWPGVLVASVVAVAGHAAIFLLSCRTAGSPVSTLHLLPIAMLVLVASSVPTNIGGWGPREGAAAWAFAASGSSAAAGVATATVYGVLVCAGALPGAAVLVTGWLARGHRQDSAPGGEQAPRLQEGAVRG